MSDVACGIETSPPADARRRGYAICSEPRSGTNFLCALIKSTGALGLPGEFFNMAGRVARSIPGYAPHRMVAALLEHGATPNGVYGLKVFSDQFDLPAEPWVRALPSLRFVHLERRDLLGQAISWARANQTGQFAAGDERRGREEFDAALIASQLVAIARGHARWRLFFARNGIQPLHLTYEEVTADPAAAVGRIAGLVDVPVPSLDPSAATYVIQRDAVSDAWREMYVRQMGDPSKLDRPSLSLWLLAARKLASARRKLASLRGALSA